jgi:hypothetical protein
VVNLSSRIKKYRLIKLDFNIQTGEIEAFPGCFAGKQIQFPPGQFGAVSAWSVGDLECCSGTDLVFAEAGVYFVDGTGQFFKFINL